MDKSKLTKKDEKEFQQKEEIVRELIRRMRAESDNEAMEKLFSLYDSYVRGLARKRLRNYVLPENKRTEMEDELYQRGWIGFIRALQKYNLDDSSKASFSTFSYIYIYYEMQDELKIQFNALGLVDYSYDDRVVRMEDDIYSDALAGEIEDPHRDEETEFTVPAAEEKGKYANERQALQILKVLKYFSDEEHSFSARELANKMTWYTSMVYGNCTPVVSDENAMRTFQKTLAEVLMEVNSSPDKYHQPSDFRVKYDGYENNELQKKITMQNEGAVKIQSAKVINGLYYDHVFSKEDLDDMIQMICFSDMISEEKKKLLIRKLIGEGSPFYKSVFWDGESMRFNPKAIYGRFSGRKNTDRMNLIVNLKKIQEALNSLGQISFVFNRYRENKELTPTDRSLRKRHKLSPYHLVVYHDNYYCIGLLENERKVMHYRVDLMSDIEIVRDEEGRIIPIELTAFEGLPIANAEWNPEKYMAEHLNMAYDDPREILVKIASSGKGYTILHDWFGNHFEKVREITEKDEAGNEEKYDIVKVITSPAMIVHWAMQYGTAVEIMDEEIREKIREEIKKVGEKYGQRSIG